MIVSYYVCRGFSDESGLFCTDCKISFSVKYNLFVDKNFKPIKDVYCPCCGQHNLYPRDNMHDAYVNYNKYKDFI